MVCTFYGLTRLPISDVLTLTNMFPIWVAVLSWPVFGEIPTGSVWLAVASGLAGVALIQQPHLTEGGTAIWLLVMSSMFSAIAMLGLHHLSELDPRAVVVHFSAVAVLFAIVSLMVFDRRDGPALLLDVTTTVLLLAVGVTGTVGQLFLTKAFAAGPPAHVSVVALSQVVFALILDVLLFGRSVPMATLGGIILILAPTAWLLTRRS
jgi:drug/metabolite transporter (DMT)-like permease